MRTRQALIYSLKVWITTVVFGFRLAGILKVLTDPQTYNVKDIFITAIYDIPIGLMACMPSWGLFLSASYYLTRSPIEIVKKKLILSLISLILAILPFAIVFWNQFTHPNYWPDMLADIIGYELITLFGVWFYKLTTVPVQIDDTL